MTNAKSFSSKKNSRLLLDKKAEKRIALKNV